MKARLPILAAIVFLTGITLVEAQTQPNFENGWKPYGSYEGSHLDTVNVMNGNLMLHAPLVPDVVERGALSLHYALFVTSKDWQAQCTPNKDAGMQCKWRKGGTGVSIQLTPGMTVSRTMDVNGTGGVGSTTYSGYGYSLTTADGATHQVLGTGALDANGEATQFNSTDTSGLHVQLSNQDANGVFTTLMVTDRQGRQYQGVFDHENCPKPTPNKLPAPGPYAPLIDDAPVGDQICSQTAQLYLLTDPDGNQISLHGPGNPNATADTLGKGIPFGSGAATTDYTGCVSSYPMDSAYLAYYTAPDGSTQQIKFCLANVPILTAFNAMSPYGTVIAEENSVTQSLPFTPVATVILADGSKWTFDYDSYGEIVSMGLPTGGTITYTWTTISYVTCNANNVTPVSRAITSRTVNDGQGHSFIWNYNWGALANGVMTNVVTDPLHNDSAHTFTALDPGVGSGGCGLYETTTIDYQGSQASNQPLHRVDTTYSSLVLGSDTGDLGGELGNVVPTIVQTTVYPSGRVNLVTKQYDQGRGANAPIFANVTVEKEYDWGPGTPGARLRETDTTYEWQVNGAYLSANMLDLPATVVVRDGGGCALSETDYTYDESAYLTASNITTQHVAAPNPVRGKLTTVTKWVAPTSTCNPKGGTAVVSHANWYDTGEVYQQIDPLGRVTTHSYDFFYAGAYSTGTCSPATNGGATTHCVSGTYDFTTGVLTSFTNENATQQASGNTPGDSAHTTFYVYDLLSRAIKATAPADPANGSAQAVIQITYPVPATLPYAVTQTRSITAGMSDSLTTTYDGLGRIYKTQHPLPNGIAEVDTTYDPLGHVASVTNPYFSTSDPTYGVTQTAYDGLGRLTQVTEQDGSVKTVFYSVAPVPWAAGDCTVATDEAGHQRKSCADALGRLVEVDEPNPGVSASYASGSVTVSGNEQQANSSPATSGGGTVTISGNENSACAFFTNHCVTTVWDSGTVKITVGSYPTKTYTYGRLDTAATVAWNLSCLFHKDTSSPVDASCPTSAGTSTTVNLVARNTGTSTNYSLITSSATGDSAGTYFSGPSFFASPASGAMTGGQNAATTPDTGTVTATIGGTNYAVSYGANDTSSTIAANLASAITAGTLANASASGSTVNITSKVSGPGHDYSLAVSYTWNNAQFANPSFTTSASGSSFTGGYNAGDPANSPFVTQYAYDGLGDLLTVMQKGDPTVTTSSQWRVRSFSYDTLGRLLTAQNPESGTISYSYDFNGNLLHKTSPAPNQTGAATQTISYCYDELNRITGRAYSAQTCSGTQLPAGTAVVSYAYDSGANAKGKLTSFTDQAGSGSYTYDVLGRMIGETRVIAGVSKNMSYAYNLDGSLKTLTYPSGATVTYTPDSAGRMLQAVDNTNGINYVTGASYGPDNGLTGFISGSTGGFAGITNSFSYNKRLQPINMSAASPSQTVFSIGYDFHVGNGTTGSDNGNVWGITNYKDNTRNQSFTYDALNRLTAAQNAGTNCAATTVNGKTEYWGNSYGYDAWGNLLQKTVTKCNAENLSIIALANNQLSGYGYDAAGNMTSDPTDSVTSTYDPENRIATAAKNGVTTAYTYDDDGNRVEKTSSGGSSSGTLYWYMSPGIVAESDLQGNLQSEYVFFDGERVARKDFPGLAVSYYFSDHLKTASVITDSAGNIKSESDYYPWGGELQFLANDSNHYKFTGKERDSETGLDYFGARYYSNGLGRWITPDWAAKATAVPYAEFADPQSLNLYTYVRNIPTSNADADGHDGWETFKLLVGAVAVLAENQNQKGMDRLKSVGKAFGHFMTSGPPPSFHGIPAPGNCGCSAPANQNNNEQNNNNSNQQNTQEQQRDAQGRFLPKKGGESAPGSGAEKEGLDAMGATKNTKPIPGSNRVPDGTIGDVENGGQYAEVKSGASVNNSEQLREMGDAAMKATGRPLKVGTTNPSVKVSGPAQENPNLDIQPAKKPQN